MSGQCAVCEASDVLLRDCKYCTGAYCPGHALPEKHDCPGLAKIKDKEQWVRDRETNIPTYRGEEVRPRPDPLDEDEITTYGSAEAEFESSPDVAVDGSIAGDSATESGEQPSEPSVVQKIVSRFKFW
ncbi:AN1-type zinc finger domain-containing protein [Halorientalis regularis]|uniref:AN1-like Zinc finger n=1 Tax=Halorientalis regularis TaxID=660518 RepID=A0A1G7TE77_9EURY|nr:AN1-type zinc finger domain-containing protein [Halorientalis regularis]SDG32860.1 AN1-like Zinc finger [Halorientalis regularis]